MRRPRSSRLVLPLVAALLAPVPARAQASTPPAVVALRLIELPDDVPDADQVRARFDSLLAELLAGAGYRAVRGDATAAAWKHAVDSIGGYYDRATGRVVRERWLAAQAAALARLRAEQGATALLAPVVEVEAVRYERGTAKWEGASQQVANMGWGVARVLTLRAIATDTTGAVLHCGSGGLRALVKYNLWNGKTKPLPPAEWFDDRERNAAAARRALASLLARAPACERS